MKTKSYFAVYHSTDNGFLVGGIKNGTTSRFGTRDDAQRRLDCIIEVNDGRVVGEIMPSPYHPDIFVHCGDKSATCIGARCLSCGKVITVADAKAYTPEMQSCEQVFGGVA